VGAVLATVLAAACGAPREPSAGAPFDVFEQTIPELQEAMASGLVTSRELVQHYLARIEAYDQRGPSLNAMISLNPAASSEAEALDRERATTGPRGPLHGVPVVVKDNYDMVGLPTTAGSVALADWYPPNDAYQVARLQEAGAVIIGKTNMHELAYGIETISSLGGQTRNPYDPTRNPGGSRGGTGAAVAASFAAAGMGSDTCGSIRIPSFHHALVGLRGTRGLSSRDGIIPLALTQDMGGPLTRSVTDLALVLDATVGRDPADETTELGAGHIPPTYTDFLETGALDGARIGTLEFQLGTTPQDQPVRRVVQAALDAMEAAGATVVPLEIPALPDLLQGASLEHREFKAQFAEYLQAPGTPVQSIDEILDTGLYHAALEARYRRAAAAPGLEDPEYLEIVARRDVVRRNVLQAMADERINAIAYPTIRRTARPIGEPQPGTNCVLASVAGLPAIVVPAGYANDGMPVGLELLGNAWAEGELIRLAYSYEQVTHHRRPPHTTPPLDAARQTSREWVATGADQVPPVETGATARVRLTWNAATGELGYDARVYGVLNDDVLFMHLHRAEPGAAGPVVVALSRPGEARRTGTIVLTRPQRIAFEAGELYFDAHTRDHLTGLVRAQVAP
jgi:Asp-tRNA(Asn)/Glu-tRNA(Gln) amidotransferase A subunit family amidase